MNILCLATGYRCVYCRQFNPSKEQRPSAATLPKNTVLIEEMESTLKSESEGGDESTVEEEAAGAGEDENQKLDKQDGEDDGREKGDGESPEPQVELAGSTSDLSSRKSAIGESDNEETEKLEEETIPYADEDEDYSANTPDRDILGSDNDKPTFADGNLSSPADEELESPTKIEKAETPSAKTETT